MSWPKGPWESGEFGESGKFGENGEFGENLPKGLTKEMIWVEGPRRKRRIWRKQRIWRKWRIWGKFAEGFDKSE